MWDSSRPGGASAGGSAKRGDGGGASSNGNNAGVSNGKAKKREGGGRGQTGVSDEQRRGSVRERSVEVASWVESVSYTRGACARIMLGRLTQSSSRWVVDRQHRNRKLTDRALSDVNDINLGIDEVRSRCYAGGVCA